jgi:hypothetical protein
MRRLILALFLVLSACSGTEAAQDGIRDDPADAPASEATVASSAAPAPAVTTSTGATSTTGTTAEPFHTYVAWMPGELVPEFGDLLTSLGGVRSVTVARTGTLHIVGSTDATGAAVDQPPYGFVIPVEAAVLDSGTYSFFATEEVAEMFATLGSDELVLSEASAGLRRLGVGGKIRFEGDIEMTVAAVVPDEVLGSTEVALTSVAAFAVDNTISRYALVQSSSTSGELEAGLLAHLPEESVVRVRARDPERSDAARAVQPQIVIKQEFGEFAYSTSSRGTHLEIDPAWLAENIVSVKIPLLGSTRCHKRYAGLLTKVMQSLIDDGLEAVIDRKAFRGCWSPRYISGTTRLSRHAFGAAADINFGNSLDGGAGSPVHPELLARMAAVGITSGQAWSASDPGHFEFYSDEPIGGGG